MHGLPRWHIDASTLNILERIFSLDQFPNVDVRKQLGTDLNVTPRQIQVWFQNRRQRERKSREMRSKKLLLGAVQNALASVEGSWCQTVASGHHHGSLTAFPAQSSNGEAPSNVDTTSVPVQWLKSYQHRQQPTQDWLVTQQTDGITRHHVA